MVSQQKDLIPMVNLTLIWTQGAKYKILETDYSFVGVISLVAIKLCSLFKV